LSNHTTPYFKAYENQWAQIADKMRYSDGLP
jgi:hypothetical protein